MISLQQYISADRIVAIDVEKREEILNRLIAQALPENDTALHGRIFKEISSMSRKKEVNMGNGFALAHTRTSEVDDIHISIGLLPRPVKYRRGEPVHTVLCIIVSDAMSRTYLSLMARLSRMLSSAGASEVFARRDPEAALAFLREFEQPSRV